MGHLVGMPASRVFGSGDDFDYTNLFSRIRAEGLTGSGSPYNDNDAIPQCDDTSGNANDWGQGTAGLRPVYKTAQINGKAAIQFTAASTQWFGGPNFNALSECEFFIVVKVNNDPPATSAKSGCWRLNTGADASAASHYPFTDNNWYEGSFIDIPSSARVSVNPTPSLASWRLANVQGKSGTNNYIVRLDGTAIVTATKTLTFAWQGSIGRSTGGGTNVYLDGLVAEWFFLSAAAGASQRTSIKDYINSYYGLSTV